MNNRRSNNKVIKNFKDYLAPIVIVVIILIFVLNYIFSWSEQKINTNTNSNPINLTLSSSDDEGYIVYSWWNKTKIEWSLQLYKSEKVQVANWSANLKNNNSELVLNKLWELSYNDDESWTLYSSDLWVKTASWISLEMRYAKVNSTNASVFSASQNEVASTIYVVSWNVEVRNLAWKSTTLQSGEKIVIMRNSASDENSDLSLSKEQIDDYTKKDDWFLKNNWAGYLSANNTSSWSLSSSWVTLSNTWSFSYNNYISFSNLYDETEVSSDSINVEWTILDDNVYKVEINWQNADIDTTNKTFKLKNLKISSRVNDLVYKVYDDSSRMLYKWIITVYYSKGSASTTTWTNSSTLAQVENYPITNSPLYQIISPKQNPYTTSDDNVRIEWNVPAKTIEKIVINDFQLQKFPAYWTYWYYFANSEFWNLKPWINIYKIQYFWAEGKLVYENIFTIVKEAKVTQTSTATETNSGTTNETSSWSEITE